LPKNKQSYHLIRAMIFLKTKNQRKRSRFRTASNT